MDPLDDEFASCAIYAISVAAELAGMHPQTLRQYDRLGLVIPERTRGRGRRYSRQDVANLREIQRLSQVEGVNLAGIRRIMELSGHLQQLRGQNERLRLALQTLAQRDARIFAAGPDGEVAQVHRAEHAGNFVRRSRHERPLRALGQSNLHKSVVLWSQTKAR